VPLSEYQRTLLAALAATPNDDRYLAGDAALHFAPTSARYSDDLDFFHDSEARVASAFAADRLALQRAGHAVDVEISQPGFVRSVVRRGADATRVDWAHDSAWRFLPLVRDEMGGLLLHPIDLAINKALALAGRDEPRDFVALGAGRRRGVRPRAAARGDRLPLLLDAAAAVPRTGARREPARPGNRPTLRRSRWGPAEDGGCGNRVERPGGARRAPPPARRLTPATATHDAARGRHPPPPR